MSNQTLLLSERLQNGHDYLASHKWCRGAYAMDAAGNDIVYSRNVNDSCAVCAMGAYYIANGLPFGKATGGADKAMFDAIGEPMAYFNDNIAHDKRDVLRKFRIAIRAAKRLGN